MKQKIALNQHREDRYIQFKCPGCLDIHQLPTSGPRAWGWNGSLTAPTLTPSILARGTEPVTDEICERILAGEAVKLVEYVCHSFVTDGKIQFLSDCTHKLAGQTVELSDVPDVWL